jgi:trans-aconitate methyltransferase
MRPIAKWIAGAALCLAPGLSLAASDMTSPGQTPAAQIPDATIDKAGAALRDVANLQQKYQPKMESATSPTAKEGLSAQANAEAVQAIQSHGLSVQEYSTVVRTAQQDPQVKQRLLDAANKD